VTPTPPSNFCRILITLHCGTPVVKVIDQWLDKHPPDQAALRAKVERFRAEAAELLGVKSPFCAFIRGLFLSALIPSPHFTV
jgi:hypothetical protein